MVALPSGLVSAPLGWLFSKHMPALLQPCHCVFVSWSRILCNHHVHCRQDPDRTWLHRPHEQQGKRYACQSCTSNQKGTCLQGLLNSYGLTLIKELQIRKLKLECPASLSFQTVLNTTSLSHAGPISRRVATGRDRPHGLCNEGDTLDDPLSEAQLCVCLCNSLNATCSCQVHLARRKESSSSNILLHLQVEKAPLESYADVGGLEQQIQEIKEAVELPLTHPEVYEDIGIKPPKVVAIAFTFYPEMLKSSPLESSYGWFF